MEPKAIADLALQTRAAAADVVVRHKKHASFQLYSVLSPCLELCERCELDPAERAILDRLFADQPKGDRNRKYVEKGSDIYVLVCRFVFTSTDYTNAMRYAHCLREASKAQISSAELVAWLKTNGGVNALYFRRPLTAQSVSMKTLHLSSPVMVSRTTEFTLQLRWNSDNTFAAVRLP